ncbi:hypothetical protein Np361112_158 [Synechococcus phage S-RIM2]|uniref:Uncharacterized protein n=1 Tax=Synechococcus phage S-RIM2 TaxID=687800 RepID=A0A1D7RQD2_9CAUD|nr:hypothetical protein Np361112_158 [Synechococcus phage S-RIM2]
MDRNQQQTNIDTDDTRSSVSVHRDVPRSWFKSTNDYPKGDRGNKCNRHYKYLPAIIALFVAAPVNAETVGGVSATASPIANSSGSVTNQAIQVLQGPYITNTYGNGIQCQGPTVNFTPYVTGSASTQKPYEPYYNDPVYDMRDLDEDGSLDNPGAILYHVPTRTGQKDNYNIGIGFSATWSRPLDKKLQDQCKAAAQANIDHMIQATANKRLDFEIARLKNCGELMQRGIRFAPGTRYASICADVQVVGKNVITPHRHTIPVPSARELPYSESAADLGAPLTTQSSQPSPE